MKIANVLHPIDKDGKYNRKVCYCYLCGRYVKDFKYCPGCGARLNWKYLKELKNAKI